MLKFFILILSVYILSACKVKQVSNYDGDNISVTDIAFKSNDLDEMIAPYKVEMESKMNKVIGHSNQSLTNFSPESPLGNFVADVVFQSAFQFGIDNETVSLEKRNTICLINFGGLRAPISEGDISIRNIYELMPFDNEIVIVSLSPDQVVEMLNYLFTKNGQPISNGQAILSSDKKKLIIGGKAYNFERHINIITSDYLAKGGDKMNFLKSEEIIQTGILMRDALLDYVSKEKELPEFKVEDRILFVK
jgi:2',3'-cyclic-nucleotide 2'-phosphodiesterase (5'-nucleotidase family)